MADKLKLIADELLFGSFSVMYDLTQQAIFIRMLALAATCQLHDGTLRHNETSSMSREMIAELIGCSKEALDRVIEIGQEHKDAKDGSYKIEVWEDGTVEILNFKEYLVATSRAILDKAKNLEPQKESPVPAGFPKTWLDEQAERINKAEKEK